MYQPKPIVASLLARAADMISTYLNVKKYSPEGELNTELRKLFYEWGYENSTVGWFAFSLLPIPVFYAISKLLDKMVHNLAGKNVETSKELYRALLYSYSAGSFYASINNLLIYFNLPYIPAEDLKILGATITALPFCFYAMRIYKKLIS
jgi:hypothetical protein